MTRNNQTQLKMTRTTKKNNQKELKQLKQPNNDQK